MFRTSLSLSFQFPFTATKTKPTWLWPPQFFRRKDKTPIRSGYKKTLWISWRLKWVSEYSGKVGLRYSELLTRGLGCVLRRIFIGWVFRSRILLFYFWYYKEGLVITWPYCKMWFCPVRGFVCPNNYWLLWQLYRISRFGSDSWNIKWYSRGHRDFCEIGIVSQVTGIIEINFKCIVRLEMNRIWRFVWV